MLFSFHRIFILAIVAITNARARLVGPSEETSEFRLPSNVVPLEYNIVLHPDYQTYTNYTGTVEISIDIKSSTRNIKLHRNATSITITKSFLKFSFSNTYIPLIQTVHDNSTHISTLTPKTKQIIETGRAVLTIEFNGRIRTDMEGFYVSTNSPTNENLDLSETANYPLAWKKLLTTQHEAICARKSFPCFDEPSFKSNFIISISIPKELEDTLTVLSNMPIETKTHITHNNINKTLCTFKKSPKMSTYLTAWAIGILESRTTRLQRPNKKTTTVSVYTIPGKIQHTSFALKVAERSLPFYENLFGIEYPLTKLDLLAVPDFRSGAMENWGLLTFRDIALLVYPQSSIGTRVNVATTVTHEIAHMWFGDYVTPKWWEDIWLNESFAEFMMMVSAGDALQNNWITKHALDGYTETAFSDDSLTVAEPISHKVSKPRDVEQMFDSMRYAKGGSILRMISEWVTLKEFGRALGIYLNKYKYSNSTSAQLFESLENVLQVPIAKVMSSFIMQPGVPVVYVEQRKNSSGDIEVIFTQRQFLNGEQQTDRIWSFPLFIKYFSILDHKFALPAYKELLMEKRQHILTIPQTHASLPIALIVNGEGYGYYIVEYSEEMFENLQNVCHLSEVKESMLKVLRDSLRLMKYRRIHLEKVKKLISNCFMDTSDHRVLSEIVYFGNMWKNVSKEEPKRFALEYLQNNPNIERVINKYANLRGSSSFKPLYSEMDNMRAVSHAEKESMYRFEILTLKIFFAMCSQEDYSWDTHTNELLKKKKLILEGLRRQSSIDNSLLAILYQEEIDRKWRDWIANYQYEKSSEIQELIIACIAAVNLKTNGVFDKAKLEEIFAFLKSDNLRLQDKYLLYIYLIIEHSNEIELVKYIYEDREYLFKTYGDSEMLGSIVQAFSVFNNEEAQEICRKLFEGKSGVETEYKRTMERINNNIMFVRWLRDQ